MEREKIKLRYILLSTKSIAIITSIAILLTVVSVFLLGWEKEIIKKLEWIFWILWIALFIFASIWLYNWVILKNDHKYPDWKFWSNKVEIWIDPSNLFGWFDDIITGLLLIVLMTVIILYVIPLIVELAYFIGFLALVFVWSVSRILKQIFKRSAFCSWNLSKSINEAFIFSFYYSWIAYICLFYAIHHEAITNKILTVVWIY